MRAAWYERQGRASDVLEVGDLEEPTPGRGEVRVRLTCSGINPGDIKKRQGWLGSAMPYFRVIPHSDGAGVIDAVGEGVAGARVGRRVWVYRAQSYRPFGTAAEVTVVPDALAVDLPDRVADETGACLGIPGITAHRAVFGDGPVTGQTVLVHGVNGGVGSLAAQLATWGGATVIGTTRATTVDDIRSQAPDGVDRIVEVNLAANIELDAAVAAQGCVIASYASADGRPELPYWPMAFQNVTLRLLGSDDFPDEVKRAATADLTRAASEGALTINAVILYPLEQIAQAHEAVEAGSRNGRVLLRI